MELNSEHSKNRPLLNGKLKKPKLKLNATWLCRQRLNRDSLNKLNRLTHTNSPFKLNALPSSMRRRPPSSTP